MSTRDQTTCPALDILMSCLVEDMVEAVVVVELLFVLSSEEE